MDCLVDNKGYIKTDSPLFLCKWNGGDTVEIHTRQTLYQAYKDTGLYDTDDEFGGWKHQDSYIFFNPLLDHLSFTDEDNYDYFDDDIYTNDNMSIQRIY